MEKVRSDAEVVSLLPSYTASRSKDFPSWLIVTCPYEDCGDVFLVRASRWLKPQNRVTSAGKSFVITGRSCPYCFRAARLPSRRRIR